MTDGDRVLLKVNSIPFQTDCFTPAQTVECAKQNRQLKFASFCSLKKSVDLIGIIEAADITVFLRTLNLICRVYINQVNLHGILESLVKDFAFAQNTIAGLCADAEYFTHLLNAHHIRIVFQHLVRYVLYLQEQGKSASTIKTDLSAIRFFHDKMSHPRYMLPGNEALGVALERRRFGQQDRTWTNSEFGKLIGRAMAEEREDYILALYLARYAGLRIHECFRMDTAAAERALRENALTVKGKGGKVRIVPIEDDRITMMLQRLLEKTEHGHKLLVPDGIPTDRAINGMQQFILRHRDAICDPTAPDRRITFHGLRHTYAAEKYTSLVNGGMTPLDAHFTVSRLLGHERPDVTDIYLASVKGGAARGK